jgi:putative ABC transport system permease protein
MLGMLLLIGLAAGSYPALYLSRFRPVTTLKGMLASGAKHSRLRRVLVVAQFALSIIMIVATLVVRDQLEYARTKSLGFEQARLVVIDINNDDVQTNFKTIKTEFLRNANVRSVSVSSRVPGDWKSFRQILVAKAGAAEDETQSMFFNGVDEDFVPTYAIDVIAGRNFSRDFATDSTALLLNETAARTLFGEEPLGKILRVPASNFEGRVVGVVRDFHFHSMHRAIAPLVMGYMPPGGHHVLHGIDYFTLRLSGANLPETIDFITKVHTRFDRVNPIELGYLEQWWHDLYRADERVGRVFGVAAGLAILIACVGLFGLAAFMAEQRTKEIGVRKVLGASVRSLVMLLSQDFTKLVLIAFVIAAPLAYFAMSQWLQDFAYRIDVRPVTLIFAGLLALAITWLTVSYQAIKAALANPVEALRYE